MKRRARLHIAIVGAGKVGTVLGRILAENGERIVAVVSRTAASARAAGKFLRCRNTSTDLSSIPGTTDLVFIATPHGAVRDVARALAGVQALTFRRIAVCHASGMLTAEALDPLRMKGATVFSFHPLQTFPRDFAPAMIVPSARGIYYGVDGSPAGVRMARRLAKSLEGHVILIPPEMREFYHAACVVASNHLAAMLSVLELMYATMTGKNRGFYRVFKPIISATLRNIEMTSPARALSGPVARGGTETVARHLDEVVRRAPAILPYFGAMSLETVRLALAKGSVTALQAEQLTTLINEYLHPPSSSEKNT
jgi:predicted short-subunit dehydrogenase-like oxidoreductase (DUF2520 family)